MTRHASLSLTGHIILLCTAATRILIAFGRFFYGWRKIDMTEGPPIQAFFCGNPDNYPPIINGSRLLARFGRAIQLCCRDDGRDWNVACPPNVEVIRIKTHGNSWQQYSSFVREALRHGKRAALYFGHDMHGLLPAKLLSTRFRR